MKLSLSLALLGTLAGTARAADCVAVALTAIPSCAQSCFLNGAPSIGCGGTDFTCQCEKEAALYAAVEGCVASACPSPSYQDVIDGASSVCNCATGVVIATTTGADGGVATTTATSQAPGTTVWTYPTTSAAGVSSSLASSTGAGVATTGTTTGATTAVSTAAVSTAVAPSNRVAIGLVGALGAAAAGVLL